ncbi:heavy metal-binding domain-containing protein [Hymenobacter sp. B81]|uniref:heavy metal-binding domain-containing protein n=1 Tax=Hymenobacter sp. B81 TaxID=3344878 RepID=UPI0037DD1B87
MTQRLSTLLLALAALFTVACSSDSTTETKTETTSRMPDAAARIGEQAYTCPMHPEVTAAQPGSCPKCGMKLVPKQAAADKSPAYRIRFAATPAAPVAGQPVELSFVPQVEGRDGDEVLLDEVHERKMHLIIVSRDLAQFYHEHPESNAAGRYVVPLTFRQGGEYVLFQDYTPTGASHQLGRQQLTVQGPAYQPTAFNQEKLTWAEGGYQATLSFDQPLQTGRSVAVRVTVRQGQRPVTNLDNYLGALGHMVIISADTERYLHVHPNAQKDKGPDIRFGTRFEAPGWYRVFLQFNHGGRVRTADFTLNVPAGPAA